MAGALIDDGEYEWLSKDLLVLTIINQCSESGLVNKEEKASNKVELVKVVVVEGVVVTKSFNRRLNVVDQNVALSSIPRDDDLVLLSDKGVHDLLCTGHEPQY